MVNFDINQSDTLKLSELEEVGELFYQSLERYVLQEKQLYYLLEKTRGLRSMLLQKKFCSAWNFTPLVQPAYVTSLMIWTLNFQMRLSKKPWQLTRSIKLIFMQPNRRL